MGKNKKGLSRLLFLCKSGMVLIIFNSLDLELEMPDHSFFHHDLRINHAFYQCFFWSPVRYSHISIMTVSFCCIIPGCIPCSCIIVSFLLFRQLGRAVTFLSGWAIGFSSFFRSLFRYFVNQVVFSHPRNIRHGIILFILILSQVPDLPGHVAGSGPLFMLVRT